MSRLAPGAAPLYTPPDFTPVPAIVPATWVPWPFPSTTLLSVLKLADAETLPCRSGWVASYPVSRTAILTPVPSYPAAHACGTWICCNGWATSSTCTRPSSWMRVAPLVLPVIADQNLCALRLSVSKAAAPSRGRLRVRRAPAGAAEAARDVASGPVP